VSTARRSWLRKHNTFGSIGIRESIDNPEPNSLEFEGIRNPRRAIETTQRDRYPTDANPHGQPWGSQTRPTAGGKRMNSLVVTISKTLE
jgi:hypothetical protein